jgi:hypothetical protein
MVGGLLAVIQTGNIASLAVALPLYLSYLFRLSPSAEKLVGVGAILVLTAANCLGVRWGAFDSERIDYGQGRSR